MTTAAFEHSGHAIDRSLIDELRTHPRNSLALGSFVTLILVIGQLTSTPALAVMIGVLYLVGMIGLIAQHRVSVLQTVAIGSMHVGAALLLAGTV